MTGKRKSKPSTKSQVPAASTASVNAKDPQPPNVDAMASFSATQKDWMQREWVEHVNLDLKKIVEFLNVFGMSLASFSPFPASCVRATAGVDRCQSFRHCAVSCASVATPLTFSDRIVNQESISHYSQQAVAFGAANGASLLTAKLFLRALLI